MTNGLAKLIAEVAALKAAIEQKFIARFEAIESRQAELDRRLGALEQDVKALDARTVPMVRYR